MKVRTKMSDTETETEFNISDLPGIGPSTAKKLEEGGYSSTMAIATASLADLVELGGMGEKSAAKIIQAARDNLDLSFEDAATVLERRQSVIKLTIYLLRI